jgi:acetamidase/formamidase
VLQITAPHQPGTVAFAARRYIRPRLPNVFGFAISDAARPDESIALEEVTIVEIADGTRHSPDTEWFASRTPVMPATTGPLRVPGVKPDDILQCAVLALAAVDPAAEEPLIVTIDIANSDTRRPGSGLIQAAVSAGGVVRLPVQRDDGLVSVGPVLSLQKRGNGHSWEPVSARVTIRCSVTRVGST